MNSVLHIVCWLYKGWRSHGQIRLDGATQERPHNQQRKIHKKNLSVEKNHYVNNQLKDGSVAVICRGMYYMNSLYSLVTGYCMPLECRVERIMPVNIRSTEKY